MTTSNVSSAERTISIAQPLPRVSPESGGLRSEAVLAFIDRLVNENLNPHALMILKDGKVLAEAYFEPFGPKEPQTVYSLSKAFTSAAIGIALDDGIIWLGEKIADLFPDDLPDEPPEELLALTIRDCLIMATGQPQEPSFAADNPIQAFLAMPFSEMPGQVFRYNTAATYMLSAALHVKGIDLESFLNDRLFTPMGISGIKWMRCPLGICTGGFGMSAVPELIATYGQLLLQEGVWQGKRLISREYLQMATSKQIETINDDEANKGRGGDWRYGYGFQFWQSRTGAYRGDGMYGQFCLVCPEKGLVLAITAFTDLLQNILSAFFEEIAAPISEQALPDNPRALSALQEKTKGLKINWPAPPDDGQQLDNRYIGSTYRFDYEPEKSLFSPPPIETISIEKNDQGLCLMLGDQPLQLKAGEEQLITVPEFSMLSWPNKLLTNCGFKNGNTLIVRFFWLEMLLKLEFEMIFADDSMKLTIYDIHGRHPSALFEGEGNLQPNA